VVAAQAAQHASVLFVERLPTKDPVAFGMHVAISSGVAHGGGGGGGGIQFPLSHCQAGFALQQSLSVLHPTWNPWMQLLQYEKSCPSRHVYPGQQPSVRLLHTWPRLSLLSQAGAVQAVPPALQLELSSSLLAHSP
jgi:hypothetical protein